MSEQSFKFKNDQYKKTRGGYSRFLNIFCESCGTHLLLYQKDGPGPLKRMYMDRILAPKILHKTQNFICQHCKKIIGTFFTYKKENRPAIRLYQNAIIKKVGKGVYPPLR